MFIKTVPIFGMGDKRVLSNSLDDKDHVSALNANETLLTTNGLRVDLSSSGVERLFNESSTFNDSCLAKCEACIRDFSQKLTNYKELTISL